MTSMAADRAWAAIAWDTGPGIGRDAAERGLSCVAVIRCIELLKTQV